MTTTMNRARAAAPAARAAAALSLLAALALSGACRDGDAARDPTARARRPAAAAAHTRAAGGPAAGSGGGVAGAPAAGAVDPRSQYDLARALSEAQRSSDAEETRAGYERIRASWTGRRFRWRVRVLEPLCRSRDACNVLPFDRAGRDKGIVHGWMPRLDLDEAGFAAIQRACAGVAACEIAVEGTLSRLVLDAENPTSLEFSRVRVL